MKIRLILTIVLLICVCGNDYNSSEPDMNVYSTNDIVDNIAENPQNFDVLKHTRFPQTTATISLHASAPICECAAYVKCPPCGVIVNMNDQIGSNIECSCAPKCPQCPPLSLIHELSSKKVK